MLELDYVLTDFLENRFERLSPDNQQRFVRLLRENDQDLQQWLIAGHNPVDRDLARIVALFRG